MYYSFARKFKKSIDLFEKAILNYQDFYSVYFELSDSYINLNMSEEAKNSLHRLFEISPGDLIVHEALNEIKNKETELVSKFYEDLSISGKRNLKNIEDEMVSNWNNFERLNELGKEAFENGYFSLSRNCFEKSLSIHDDNEIYFLVGMSDFKNEKYRDAATIFLELLKNDSKNGKLYFNISNSYYHLGDIKKSERYLKTTFDLNYISFESFELMFNIIKNKSGDDSAIWWATGYANKHDKEYFPYYVLSLYFFEKQDYEKASSNMEKAIIRAHDNEQLYVDMVKILSAKGDYYKIPKLLKNISPLVNIEPFHLWNIGVVCRKMNKKDEAIKIFEKILSMNIPFEYKKRAEEEIENMKVDMDSVF
jgi:tetratricopeptide (TPR) repeat protein